MLVAVDLEGAAVPHLNADIEAIAAGSCAANDLGVGRQRLCRTDVVA